MSDYAMAAVATTAASPGVRLVKGEEPQHHLLQCEKSGVVCCEGDGCVGREPWPVHHVRHRGNLRRLCTSCVLGCHRESFCSHCFELLDRGGVGGRTSALVHCSECSSVCHAACLPDAREPGDYVCPCCANPEGFSYFRVDLDCDVEAAVSPRKKATVAKEKRVMNGQWRRVIDRKSAKVLLVASQLASASMKRAVSFSRNKVERKAKDAAIARKKAEEMLAKVFMAAKEEDEKRG
ncbi:unnamed protein product [Spirodela intermedia]|uniref:Phorbol-ester/DAG-type domain-containing protein n=1 Tax=Spirodela intermedia TaxID=51605 RepID=A0A7I8KL91_SPIIN|nr:unnamed protein product [Spirodela intermedia]